MLLTDCYRGLLYLFNLICENRIDCMLLIVLGV